jgi:NADPH2 dehydrogenase
MKDPIPTFSTLTSELKKRFPDLAYLHVTEGRFDDRLEESEVRLDTRNDPLRDLWAPKPYISAGAATFQTGIENAEKKGDVIAYGRYYLANVSIHYTS